MTVSIQAFNCPQCGGELQLPRRICNYCGTTVELSDDRTALVSTGLSCPACFTNHEHGERFCGRCGEALVVDCPVVSCHTSNSVWRKFCCRCGADMDKSRCGVAIKEMERNLEQLAIYESDLNQAYTSIDGARTRQRVIRLMGGSFGLLVGLAVASLSVTWGIVVGGVVMLSCGTYHSSELDDLTTSIEVCERRVTEIRVILETLTLSKH